MIDLHTHTNLSDGSQTLTQLLEKAEKTGLSVLSITDHNCVEAYNELTKIDSKLFTGKIITGTEVYFYQDGIYNELLGYKFDLAKISQNKIFDRESGQQVQVEILNILYSRLINKGFMMSDKQILIDKLKQGRNFGITECYNDLVNYSSNNELLLENNINNLIDFYVRWADNKTSDMYVNSFSQFPNMHTVSQAIRDAGGLVFMAHIFRKSEKEIWHLLNYAVENKLIDGIEVYYRNNTQEQREILLAFCQKHNLFVSGGTDSHHLNQQLGLTDIGPISDDVIQDWL